MKHFIKKVYSESIYGYIIINPIKRIFDRLKYLLYSDENFVRKAFKKNLGYDLNLDNPQTLNEKIQWLKLNDRTKLHTLCSDKLAVREYIKEQIGEEYLIPLILSTTNTKELTPTNLPDIPVIIKTNHDSGNIVIVKDKSLIDWKITQIKFASSLKNNFYYIGREWQYKNIKPSVLVEKLLLDENNEIPNDYKLHCFNGKLIFIQVDTSRFENHKRNLYDINWNLIECKWMFDNGSIVEKPKNMDKMLNLAEKLAQNFDYVRVDFYTIGNKIYFGELTFSPGSGWEKFYPNSFDYILGKQLKLSNFLQKGLNENINDT